MAYPSLTRRPSPFSDDDNTAGTAGSADPSSPALSRPPVPLGTAIGGAARTVNQTIANGAVDAINAGKSFGAGAVNALTYPARAGLGITRDVVNAASGLPQAPNAGDALPGVTPTLLTRPFANPGAPQPDLSGGNGGTSPAAAAAPVAGAPMLTRPAPISSSAAGGTFAGVQGGVLPTAPGGQRDDVYGGVDIGGHHLNYGAMVNGVPTFSDGSSGVPGVAGKIPRTMSDDTIKHLGDGLQTQPAQITPLLSDTLGHTASSAEAASLRQPTQQPITGSRPSAAQFAASDANAIALRDPRSALGTAANNLAMDAEYAGSGRSRRAAAQQLGVLATGDARLGEQAIAADAGNAQANTQGQNALALERMRGNFGLQNTVLETARTLLNNPREQVQLADGSIGLVGRDGSVTPAKLPDGSVAKKAVVKDDADTKRANSVLDQLAKGVQGSMNEYQKTQALVPADQQKPMSGKQIQDLRAQHAQALGLSPHVNPSTGELIGNINGQWVKL